MNYSFLNRILKKPPTAFPWVALFHVLLFVYALWGSRIYVFPSLDWLTALWALLFAVSWLFICDLKKWAAYLYLGLTTLNLVLRFTLTSETDLALYTHSFFPIDILFCFFILFYFKEFK